MNIVKCSQCRRLIHMSGVCFFCGSIKDSPVVSSAEVHENAAAHFALAEAAVSQGRFAEAKKALIEVMRWSATSSEVHWLRLLAEAGCKNDRELFLSGIDISGAPDCETALRYASEEEKQVYSAVINASSALKTTLINMINSRNAKLTADMQPEETLRQMKAFVGEKTSYLLAAWQELRKCEQEMKLLENEGLIYIHESRHNMQSIRDEASTLRQSLENTEELSRKEFLMYKAKLEGMKKTAESAKEEYYRLKSQHPSVKSFDELCQKRSGIKAQIDSTLAEIRQYETEIEALIENLNAKKRDGNILLEMAEAGNYKQVINALGQSNFDRAVHYALSI